MSLDLLLFGIGICMRRRGHSVAYDFEVLPPELVNNAWLDVSLVDRCSYKFNFDRALAIETIVTVHPKNDTTSDDDSPPER